MTTVNTVRRAKPPHADGGPRPASDRRRSSRRWTTTPSATSSSRPTSTARVRTSCTTTSTASRYGSFPPATKSVSLTTAVGNELSESDANGHPTQFAYDRLNRMTSRTDAVGNEVRFTYDEAGNVRVEEDVTRGLTSTTTYDLAEPPALPHRRGGEPQPLQLRDDVCIQRQHPPRSSRPIRGASLRRPCSTASTASTKCARK